MQTLSSLLLMGWFLGNFGLTPCVFIVTQAQPPLPHPLCYASPVHWTHPCMLLSVLFLAKVATQATLPVIWDTLQLKWRCFLKQGHTSHTKTCQIVSTQKSLRLRRLTRKWTETIKAFQIGKTEWWQVRYLMRGINGEKLGLKYLNVGKILMISVMYRVKCKLCLRSKTPGWRNYKK